MAEGNTHDVPRAHGQRDAESTRELGSALQVWTNQVRGLSKLVTRVRVECQVRSVSVVQRGELAAQDQRSSVR